MPLAPPMQPPSAPPGPASPPTGNPGQMAAAMAKVREAILILEKALPEMQVGSDPHKACVDAIKSLSKGFPATAAMPGIQNTALMGLQKDAQESAQMRMLMQAMGGAGGAPGGPPGGGQAPMAAPGGM